MTEEALESDITIHVVRKEAASMKGVDVKSITPEGFYLGYVQFQNDCLNFIFYRRPKIDLEDLKEKIKAAVFEKDKADCDAYQQKTVL